jgi:uncharacterized protein YjbI with pentapeptide repeats
MRTLTQDELTKLLDDHADFVRDYQRGETTIGDTRRAILDDIDFRGMKLGKVNLRYASLRGAILDECNLGYADLSHADLSGAQFRRTRLVGARLNSATLNRTTFEQANLGNADLGHVTGFETSFAGANMQSAMLTAATLQFASFRDADLRYADVTGATFDEHAEFQGVDIREARFTLPPEDLNRIASVSKGSIGALAGASIDEGGYRTGDDAADARLARAHYSRALVARAVETAAQRGIPVEELSPRDWLTAQRATHPRTSPQVANTIARDHHLDILAYSLLTPREVEKATAMERSYGFGTGAPRWVLGERRAWLPWDKRVKEAALAQIGGLSRKYEQQGYDLDIEPITSDQRVSLRL